ncbi:MAG: NAD(P)-dependent oxidoreductase [Chloroflexi bacterium]|nr:NAD(P)-dependent oxidoreductase [Chloroflexota bacterium]
MRVLITGGCGFVGAFTALAFVEAGHDVVCYDRRAVLNDVLAPVGGRLTLVAGDVLDRDHLGHAVREHGVEGIVHAAAVIGQADGAADPEWMIRINVQGTAGVLELARAAGLRVVYVSTATLYGQHPDLHVLSEEVRPEPVGLYDTTKLMAETLAITYHKVFDLDVVAVRPGYVYGHHTSTGGYFLDRVAAGEVVEQAVGADLPIDVTYVKDVARGILLAMMVRPLQHRIFNITGGVLRRRGHVAEIARQLVPGADIRLGPGIPATAHLRGPSDLTRARTELGYAPRFGLEAGMADWLTYLRPSSPPDVP